MSIEILPAAMDDCEALNVLITRSARALCVAEYTPAQVDAALKGAFGVDTQLVRDGTYYAAMEDGRLIGCGGWSKRATMFGGDAHADRDARLLDPAVDAARIRAFFIDPDAAGKGVGRLILERCERDARADGFTHFELMATLTGAPFYRRFGYVGEERKTFPLDDDETIDFIPMKKAAASSAH